MATMSPASWRLWMKTYQVLRKPTTAASLHVDLRKSRCPQAMAEANANANANAYTIPEPSKAPM